MKVSEFNEKLTALLEQFNESNGCVIMDISLDVHTIQKGNETPKMRNPNI